MNLLLRGICLIVDVILNVLWYIPHRLQLDQILYQKFTRHNSLRHGEKPANHIFALLVGINWYKHSGQGQGGPSNLQGCLADVADIKTFLLETLLVPPSNITTLLDEQATAVAITKALQALATASEKDIPTGSTFVIFFAGHGSLANPPNKWRSSGKIQSFVPHDMYYDGDEVKNGFTDIKFGQLLEGIASAKGNNITVISDYCFSGSGTRVSNGKVTSAVRHFHLPSTAAFEPDAMDIDPSRASGVLKKSKNKGLTAHVLLAACQDNERAHEDKSSATVIRGCFTFAITQRLRDTHASEGLKTVTYHDVINSLPTLASQKPQCEGRNRDCVLFTTEPMTGRPIFYPIYEQEDGLFVMDGGEAHGVTEEARFAVYENPSCKEELMSLEVETTRPFSSILRHMDDSRRRHIPKGITYVAVQKRIGTTHDTILLVQDEELSGSLTKLGQEMQAEQAWKPSFKVVASTEQRPDLVATSRGNIITFFITDPTCQDAGLHEIPVHPASNSVTLTPILRAVTNFYWNLNHGPSNGKHPIIPAIEFECHRLKYGDEKPGDAIEKVYTTDGPNLFINNRIELDIDTDCLEEDRVEYGYTIRNKLKNTPLFVSAFTFTMSDFSIDDIYLPPVAKHTTDHVAPLPPGGILTLGYDSDVARPTSYSLGDGQDIDVDYIKLFFSTEYVDYSHIRQSSPFSSIPLENKDSDMGRKLVISKKAGSQPVWDVMLIPIIQHRKGTRKVALSY